MSVTQQLRHRADLFAFGTYLGLVAVGWLMIFAVGYEEDGYTMNTFFSTAVGKQTIWIGISLFAFVVIQLIDWKVWQSLAIPFFIISIVALGLVLTPLGTSINGASSWFRFGSFTFQPSELAKVGTSLVLASFLGNYNTKLQEIRSQLIVLVIIGIPMLLILMQPDAGSVLVFTSFLLVFYRAGLPGNYYTLGFFSVTMLILGLVFSTFHVGQGLVLIGIFILSLNYRPKIYGFAISVLFAISIYILHLYLPDYQWSIFSASILTLLVLAALLWQIKKQQEVSLVLGAIVLGTLLAFVVNFGFNKLMPHQQDRINVWLRPHLTNAQGAAYNLINSKMAIGAGGFEGKGFLNGTLTKLNYVPEQMTDFIFCTIGEEQGFVGSVAVILLFFLLLYRITVIAERQRNKFIQYYAYCVAGIIFIHFFINIGMTMGLMPIIGIPLPFISKGGSSLLFFTIMLAILLKMDSARK